MWNRLTAAVFAVALLLGSRIALAATQQYDIKAPMSGDLSLGDHWFPFESHDGAGFRWVDHDAQILIRKPAKHYSTVNIKVEGGPGLGTTEFPLIVKDSRNGQVAGTFVKGRETVNFVLPVDPNGDNRFSIAAIGGGHQVGNDKRILNFRVFSIDDGPTAGNSGISDVTGSGVRLGNGGWYPLETYAGQTFRWISNDAPFNVNWPHDQATQIRVIAEPGPGVGATKFTLHLQDASGHNIAQASLAGRAIANFPVSLHQGDNGFKFHVDGGGRKAPNDARTLNFRVFGLSALQ